MDIVEIYAEIPKKLYGEMEDKGQLFELPDGVSISRKRGSRVCYFECETKDGKDALIDILDQKGINWQIT